VPDVLIVADSIRSPEIRHEVPLAVPDPFLYLEHDGRRVAVVGSFEVPRVQELGTDLEIYPFEHFGLDELMKQGLKWWQVSREIWLRACKEAGVTSAVVPHAFPLEVADHLRANGVEVRADRELFNARRRAKNEFELAGIRRAQRACEAGMDAARDLFRRGELRNGGLAVDGAPLTCERVRAAVEGVFTDHGVSAEESIVSHGPQTAVGHDMGSGPIAASEPIVLDLFPRDRETGCFADMTRTFVVGRPPAELVRYQQLVREALDRAIARVRAGVNGREVFDEVCDLFEGHGYPTLRSKEAGTVLEDGFYHGLGHGVGLEVHEYPVLSRLDDELKAGDVITIEPGLYRKGFGGCRLEDIVRVTDEGAELLTDYPYELTP